MKKRERQMQKVEIQENGGKRKNQTERVNVVSPDDECINRK